LKQLLFSPTLIHFHVSQNKIRGRHTIPKDLRPDDTTTANSTLAMFLRTEKKRLTDALDKFMSVLMKKSNFCLSLKSNTVPINNNKKHKC